MITAQVLILRSFSDRHWAIFRMEGSFSCRVVSIFYQLFRNKSLWEQNHWPSADSAIHPHDSKVKLRKEFSFKETWSWSEVAESLKRFSGSSVSSQAASRGLFWIWGEKCIGQAWVINLSRPAYGCQCSVAKTLGGHYQVSSRTRWTK